MNKSMLLTAWWRVLRAWRGRAFCPVPRVRKEHRHVYVTLPRQSYVHICDPLATGDSIQEVTSHGLSCACMMWRVLCQQYKALTGLLDRDLLTILSYVERVGL
jgi:hypothetical protein